VKRPARRTYRGARAASIGTHVFLACYALLTLAPFVWAILTSLKTQREIASGDTVWPQAPTLQAYQQIWHSDFTTWVINSLAVSLAVTVLSVVLNTMAGYALARLRFAGRNAIFRALLLMVMVPTQVTMVPAFIVVARAGLVDSPWAIILTSVVNIASIFMMRQFFVNFPVELEEAAKLDGCSTLGIFMRIVVPLATPALAAQAVFNFMAVWNEFMKPLLYISSVDKYMLTQGLNALAKQYERASAWNIIMAGSLISLLPILLLYIVLNKHILNLNDRSVGLK
jgi:multiple sugar transport system permease protein